MELGRVCESLGARGAAEVCNSHPCNSNIISCTPEHRHFDFPQTECHLPVPEDGIYGEEVLGALWEAVYLCTAPDLSALFPGYFSPGFPIGSLLLLKVREECS